MNTYLISVDVIHHVCFYCHLFDVYSGHLHALILCLFPVGHRGDDEHCSKWAEGARTAEFCETRSWRGARHPGADEERSHTGQLHRVPEPTPRPPAAAHRHGAAHAPQHQLLQRYHEHLQAHRGPAHGGAAQAPRPAAQTHGGDTQDGSGAASGGPSTGSTGQILHHVIHCGPNVQFTAVRARFIVDFIANEHGDVWFFIFATFNSESGLKQI